MPTISDVLQVVEKQVNMVSLVGSRTVIDSDHGMKHLKRQDLTDAHRQNVWVETSLEAAGGETDG